MTEQRRNKIDPEVKLGRKILRNISPLHSNRMGEFKHQFNIAVKERDIKKLERDLASIKEDISFFKVG